MGEGAYRRPMDGNVCGGGFSVNIIFVFTVLDADPKVKEIGFSTTHLYRKLH